MSDTPQRFAGRTVMVTGAGTGYGAEIAVRAAQEGARTVVVHYRSSAAGAEQTAERVRA
jgi:NAD(P)-dependent dehydrogenase (short-subunit alcohol dehydrogenase family)